MSDGCIGFMARRRGNIASRSIAPESGIQHETKVDRVVATICDGVAKILEAMPAGDPAMRDGVGAGTSAGHSYFTRFMKGCS